MCVFVSAQHSVSTAEFFIMLGKHKEMYTWRGEQQQNVREVAASENGAPSWIAAAPTGPWSSIINYCLADLQHWNAGVQPGCDRFLGDA